MRIAYSCAGEGFGHAARTSVLGPMLERGHKVFYFAPETVRGFLEAKIGRRDISIIPQFSFDKRGEQVLLLGSIVKNLPVAASLPAETAALSKRLRDLRIDAVVSDFEPFLPRAAWMAGLPVFQINHPGIVQRVGCVHPLAWLTAIASRLLEGPWHERVHISFYGGDAGPILRRELFRHRVSDGDYVLLNLKPCYRPGVLPEFERLGIAYKVFPGGQGDFEEALAGCSCVVSSAGHQIIAEALALGKPILVIPQRGQWEQRLNASKVEETGKGMATTFARLADDLPAFLARLGEFRAASLPDRFDAKDNSAKIAAMIRDFLKRRCAKRAFSPSAAPALAPNAVARPAANAVARPAANAIERPAASA
jgi:UDP:flavonoid glycosyltransferase YjiC (YdhE family)